MARQEISGRIIHKHDIEANWLKAVNFIPRAGEIIVYDKDENYSYERFKIGDGTTNVNDLVFTVNVPDWNAPEGAPGHVLNRTHWVEQDMVEILPECQPTYSDNLFVLTENFPTFVVGETYIVNWNGVEYECVGLDMDALSDGDFSGVGLGNMAFFGEPDSGEPFMILPNNGVLLMMAADGATELTLSIKGETEVVHKLPSKFLPETVSTKTYVDTAVAQKSQVQIITWEADD